jgi:Secretion system C-terminal sorting domain
MRLPCNLHSTGLGRFTGGFVQRAASAIRPLGISDGLEGFGGQGQLGNGSNSSSFVPTQVGTDTDWLNVSGGGGFGFAGATNDHYLGLKTNKELFSWGKNFEGVLGNNITTDVNTPTSICNTVKSNEIVTLTDVLIFPNPTNNIINVESDIQIKSLIVIDIFGKKIKENTNSNQVDISDFGNGTYLLKIEILDGHYATKVFSIIK